MRFNNTIALVVILFLGIVMCFFAETDNPFSLKLTMLIFTLLVVVGFKTKISKFSFLTRTMVIIYALPFVHCFEHLVNPGIIYGNRIWGLVANPYNANPEIIIRMAMNGCIGMLGLVAGYLLFKKISFRVNPRTVPEVNYSTLSLGIYLFFSILCVVLAFLSSPRDTLFIKAYTHSYDLLGKFNIRFDGMRFLSYVYAALLSLDAFSEMKLKIRRKKIGIMLMTLFFVVVWFGYLRGDREWIGIIAGLIALYIMRSGRGSIKSAIYAFRIKGDLGKNKRKRNIIGAIILALVILVASQVLGTIRNAPFRKSIYEVRSHEIRLRFNNFLSGTWSAVLLTPLSVTGDFHNGLMEKKMGRTYLDYVLSLPPGPIAQVLNYDRPITSYNNPAREMRYGMGGVHVMVVPYMNFKSFGVFFVLMLYGVFIAYVERRAMTNNFMDQFLYVCIFIAAPHWFWYGDMVLIRILMAFGIAWASYRIFTKKVVYYQETLSDLKDQRTG